MIGRIYIEGQIGSSYKDDGSIDVRGVELQDVVSQVRKNIHCESIYCHITSPGGSVDVGRKIAEYLRSLPNIYTVADTQCASIATEVHLSVPVERRQIIAGTSYLIHQPMFSLQRGISLNQDELALMSKEIGKTQGEMVAMYAKATGMDKVSLELLMQQETSLTAEQCKDFGFVSQIITSPMKAVALLTTPKKEEDMSKLTEEIKAMRLQIAQLVAGQTVAPVKAVSLDVTTNDGLMLIIVTEADVPAVGDGVMLEDGSNAEDGTYETPMGQMVVVDGAVSEYVPVELPANPEAELLAIELEALKAENAEAKAEMEALKVDVVAMAKLTSTYKPKAAQVAFKKPVGQPTKEEGSYSSIKESRKTKLAK